MPWRKENKYDTKNLHVFSGGVDDFVKTGLFFLAPL